MPGKKMNPSDTAEAKQEVPKAPPKSAAKAAPKTPAMTADRVRKIATEEMAKTLAGVQDTLDGFKAQLDSLEHRFGRLEISAPPELRSLDAQAVEAIIKADPYAEFEVLASWRRGTSRMPAGRKLRADHYPRLLDYVKAGLRVGRPDDQSDVIAKYRADAQQRMAIAKEEAISRAKAEAEATRIKLEQMSQ